MFREGVGPLPFDKIILKKREIPGPLRIDQQTKLREESLMKYLVAYEDGCQMERTRKQMALYAEEHGVQEAAKEFKCHRNTITKWKKRFKELGEEGLSDQSRAPHHIPHKIVDEKIVHQVCQLRNEKGYGAERLKYQYDLTPSHMAIHRILKEHKKILPRKKPHKRKQDLWEVKQKYKALQTKLQLDGKVLTDIPHYYPYYVELGLPKWQFTLRCVKSGATFLSFMSGERGTEACTFIVYAFEHFKRHGVKVEGITLQIDAASYAVNFRSFKKSAFRKLIESYGAKLKIVPGGKTKQSDVETFHKLIQVEFYDRIDFTSQQDFYGKAYEYLKDFNFIRKNRHKDKQPPIYFVKQDQPHLSQEVLDLPPIYLDQHADLYFARLNPYYVKYEEFKWLDTPPDELPCDGFSLDEYLDVFIQRVYTALGSPSFLAHDVPRYPKIKLWKLGGFGEFIRLIG